MQKQSPRLREIAQESGLSLATVDRVLNQRGHTSERAQRKIADAILSLENGSLFNQTEFGTFDLILPRNAGLSTEYLAAYFKIGATRRGIDLRHHYVNRLDPIDLQRILGKCLENGSAGIAFQALEEVRIRSILLDAVASSIPLVAVVSGLSSSSLNYVGLDNRAAGRTAAYMMSALNHSMRPIAVVWGGHLYHGHEERESGFRSYFRNFNANTEIVDVRCSQDDADEAFELVNNLLEKRRDLSGVYCIGGGIIGTVKAIENFRNKNGCIVIGHNLTSNTRDFLLQNLIDVVIHQDMQQIAEKTLDIFCLNNKQNNIYDNLVPIEIITKENIRDNIDIDNIIS